MGALACLAQILGQGNNSILYQELVKKQIALQANAFSQLSELSGEFTFQVAPYPGKSLSSMYYALTNALEAFEKRGVLDEDIEKFKGGIESQLINGLQSVAGKVSQLAQFQTMTGNPNMIGKLIKMYQAVTKEDVMRVYDQYIRLRHPVVLSVLPKDQDKLTTVSNNYVINKENYKAPNYGYTDLKYVKAKDKFDAALRRQAAPQPGVHVQVHAVVSFDAALAEVLGEGDVIVDLPELRRLHVVDALHDVAAAVRQARIERGREVEPVEVGRADGAVVGHRLVAPAPPDVRDLERRARRDLLLNARAEVPAVLANVPAVEHLGVVRRGDGVLAEVLVGPGPALAVGRRVHQVAVGRVIASARVAGREGEIAPIAGGAGRHAVRRLLQQAIRAVRVVGGRIPPHAELERRLAVAEQVVRPRRTAGRCPSGRRRRPALERSTHSGGSDRRQKCSPGSSCRSARSESHPATSVDRTSTGPGHRTRSCSSRTDCRLRCSRTSSTTSGGCSRSCRQAGNRYRRGRTPHPSAAGDRRP